MKTIKINNRIISEISKPFIVAEAGVNYCGAFRLTSNFRRGHKFICLLVHESTNVPHHLTIHVPFLPSFSAIFPDFLDSYYYPDVNTPAF